MTTSTNNCWPVYKIRLTKFTSCLLFVILFLSPVLSFTKLYAQSADIDQYANGKLSNIATTSGWQNGNLNVNNSHFVEGYSVPYRINVGGLTGGTTYIINIGFDVRENSKWALDYLTSFQYLNDPSHNTIFGHAQESVPALAGLSSTGLTELDGSTVALPTPNWLNTAGNTKYSSIAAADLRLSIFGGTANASDVTYSNTINGSLAAEEQVLRVKFTVNGSGSNKNVVFAWGGRIASQAQWGIGNSASSINGSPYHAHVVNILSGDGSQTLVNTSQDRSLKTDAVVLPPDCSISGTSTACSGTTSSIALGGNLTDAAPVVTAYAWTIPAGTNSTNAVISGTSSGNIASGSTTVPGVTIVPSSGSFTSGSFIALLTVSRDFLGTTFTHTCQQLVTISGPSVTFNTQIVSCFSSSTGGATAIVSGGATPYSYNWSNGGTSSSISNVPAGTYNLTVTDNLGCTTTGSAIISQPPAPVTATAAGSPVSCFGGSNGSVGGTVSGGTAPYSVKLMQGATQIGSTQTVSSSGGTYNFASLAAGNYTVAVTDNAACTTSQNATVGGPSAAVSVTATPAPVSCFGGNNGSIAGAVSGGTAPYSVKLFQGATQIGSTQTVNTSGGTYSFTGLTAGNYTVSATDNAGTTGGCASSQNATVSGPSAAVSLTATPTPVACFGGNNGTIGGAVSGGTAPYSVKLFQGATQIGSTQTVASSGGSYNFTGLTAGSYTVSVTDNNGTTGGCASSQNATVTGPSAAVSLTATPSPVACFGGSNGSITGAVSGGTAPYSVKLFQGATQIGSTQTVNTSGGTYTFNGLPVGNYTVSVTDNNGTTGGCASSQNATVSGPSAGVSVTATPSPVSCFGGNNGAIAGTVTGGTAPYSVKLMQGATQIGSTQTVSTSGGSYSFGGLIAGNYTVSVTDNSGSAGGCAGSQAATVSGPSAAVSVTATPTPVSCFGGNNGTISGAVTGGTPPYSVKLMQGATQIGTTQTVTGAGGTYNFGTLTAGNYIVSVTDNNGTTGGCASSQNATVSGPSAAVNVTATPTPVACFGGNNGTISGTVSGGTAPYSVKLFQGATQIGSTQTVATSGGSYNFTALTAGNYTVSVTDNNGTSGGCASTQNATVSGPSAGVSVTATPSPVLCYGGNNGSIAGTVSGGTAPYSVKLFQGATQIGSTQTVNTSGGSYSFTSLTAGSYTVSVTDNSGSAGGCAGSQNATVNGPSAAVSATATPSPVSCYGGNNGSITGTVSGGTAPYSVKLMQGATQIGSTQTVNASGGSYNFTGLTAGSYTVAVTDNNGTTGGCATSQNATVNGPSAAVSVTATPTPVSCYGGTNGTITGAVSGGTAPYSVKLFQGATQIGSTQTVNSSGGTYSFTGLSAGNYTVSVTDNNGTTGGCASSQSATVSGPSSAVSAIASSTPTSCNGNTGSVSVSPSGGTPGYSYLWNTGATDATVSGLGGGHYTVTVTDANKCTTTAETDITVTPCPVVFGTYTQGYYGGNGKSCDGINQYSSPIDLINALLSQGPITLGDPTGKYVKILTTEATTVNAVMPGGGTASALPAGTACDMLTGCTGILTKQGRIGNVLLSQTLALTLNSRMGGLGNFELNYNGGGAAFFYVQNSAGSCGSGGPVACTYNKVTIPASVINYLTSNGVNNPVKVTNLLALANKLLGGTLVPGSGVPSYTDVNSAIDALNTGFDEWKIWAGNWNTNLSNPTLSGVSATLSNTCLSNASVSISHSGTTGAPYQYRVSWTTLPSGSTLTNTGWNTLTSSPIVFSLTGQPVNAAYAGTLAVRNSNTGCTQSSSFGFTPSCAAITERAVATGQGSVLASVNKLSVDASPNPFRSEVRFTITSPKAGQAQLEVYNMLGQRLATIYDGYIQANGQQIVNYKATAKVQQGIIYLLRVNGEQVTGKLLHVNE